MADWAGKTLGDIHIEKLVARGGMAEVYRGIHDSHGTVAVKIMRGLIDPDSDQQQRFQREAEVVSNLQHPHIVKMYEYIVQNETPCLVMDFIQGPSLAAYLKYLHDQKQRMPIGVVAAMLKSVASALDYAHSKGLVHRDIKPANVLLRSPSQDIFADQPMPLDVEPILTDFGLVRLLDSTMHTTTGSVSGTPAYMSPEQSRGEKVDKRTDIYSLGIVLYEMLAGIVPFQADTTFGMLMKHINEPPPPIPGISSDVQAILDRTLAKDPSLRYDSAGELANEFLAVFNGQTISPGTLHIAQMARQVAEASAGQAEPIEKPNTRWRRIGIEIAVILGLGLLLLRFLPGTTSGVTTTPTAVNPNIPVGIVTFNDFVAPMDDISISVTGGEKPTDGVYFTVWLMNEDKSVARNIGELAYGEREIGELRYTDPNGSNLLASFSQVVVTKEQNRGVSTPSEAVIFSSVFPPQALDGVRNIMGEYENTPNSLALMQGVYYYNGAYIDTMINGDPEEPDYVGLAEAYALGDETTFRLRLEELINITVGDASDLYQDYNQNGAIENGESDGFGNLPSSNGLGYLGETALNAKNAADAADSTPNIRTQSQTIQACVATMTSWTNELLPLLQTLNEIPFGNEMQPTVVQVSALGKQLFSGLDVNQNGVADPVEGECGAATLYQAGWDIAEMRLYIGEDRVPPNGK